MNPVSLTTRMRFSAQYGRAKVKVEHGSAGAAWGPISNRGIHPLPGFETIFTIKEGARNVFPPYTVEKIFEDYVKYQYDLEMIGIYAKSEKYPIKSPFPPSRQKSMRLRGQT